MLKKKKTCSNCGLEQLLWSKKLCKGCFQLLNPSKPLNSSNKLNKGRKSIRKVSDVQKEKNELKKAVTRDLHEWFQMLYDKHPTKRCEECGKYISSCGSINWHHLLPKSKFPQWAKEEKNMIFLCADDHTQAESDLDKVPITKQRTLEAKKYFGLIE